MTKRALVKGEKKEESIWSETSIDKEAQRIIKYLKRCNSKTKERKIRIGKKDLEAVFLFAYFISQKGYKNEANLILGEVFENAGDLEGILVSELNDTADAEYRGIFKAFRREGDLQAYHDSLSKLLKRFSTVWNRAESGEKVLKAVEKSLAKPIPELISKNFSAKNCELVKRLVTDKGKVSKNDDLFDSLWDLKNKDGKTLNKQEDNEGNKDVVHEILDGKMNSIPLLIALIKDKSFCHFINDKFSCDRFRVRSEFYARKTTDSLPVDIPRPINRGEFARILLSGIVTQDNSISEVNFKELSDEYFQKYCDKWYQKYKSKSLKELAGLYLREGNQDERRIGKIIDYLMHVSGGEKSPSVEKYILENRDDIKWGKSNPRFSIIYILLPNFEILLNYVKQKDDMAQGLLVNYAKNLKTRIHRTKESDVHIFGRWTHKDHKEKKYQKIVSKINTLKELVSAESTKKNLQEVIEWLTKIKNDSIKKNIDNGKKISGKSNLDRLKAPGRFSRFRRKKK